MATEDDAAPHFGRHGLADAARVSDPKRRFYRAFGLGDVRVGAVLSPTVWVRSLTSSLGHGFGLPLGDVRQMPGAFVIEAGRIVAAFRHATPADRPDYEGLTGCAGACGLE